MPDFIPIVGVGDPGPASSFSPPQLGAQDADDNTLIAIPIQMSTKYRDSDGDVYFTIYPFYLNDDELHPDAGMTGDDPYLGYCLQLPGIPGILGGKLTKGAAADSPVFDKKQGGNHFPGTMTDLTDPAHKKQTQGFCFRTGRKDPPSLVIAIAYKPLGYLGTGKPDGGNRFFSAAVNMGPYPQLSPEASQALAGARLAEALGFLSGVRERFAELRDSEIRLQSKLRFHESAEKLIAQKRQANRKK